MSRNLIVFIIRWLFNSLGIWIAMRLLGAGYTGFINTQSMIGGILLAGLVFSLVNTVLKPLLVILSLPAILLSLGLFMIVVNGVMVYISLAITGISMSFLNSILTGMILSLINYIVSATLLVSAGEK